MRNDLKMIQINEVNPHVGETDDRRSIVWVLLLRARA